MLLHITQNYLWFPVKKENPCAKLNLSCGDVFIQEIDIHLGGSDSDFYTCMDVSEYKGRDLHFCTDGDPEVLKYITNREAKPENRYPYRPRLHFAPELGWINDPNGLIYHEGVYHLFHQWNPYGTEWGNMHWGHGVSEDLISWEHQPVAMEADKYGTVYSGCAIADEKNLLGFGENTPLFYYTAAGGRNEWSRKLGNKFTQRLAYAQKGSSRLVKSDKFQMDFIVGENRDPKIFYHEPSSAYIMTLYLDGNEYAVYRSKDLINWEETQRMEYKGMWECPDLFELPVDEDENNKKWVFWSADGFYVVGTFDGYQFKAESEIQNAYTTRLPYAAQSYAGIEKQVVSIAWLRMENDRGNYRGIMAIPTEVSLRTVNGSIRTSLALAVNLEKRKQPAQSIDLKMKQAEVPFQDKAAELKLTWDKTVSGVTRITAGNLEMEIDHGTGKLICGNGTEGYSMGEALFSSEYRQEFTVIFDQEAAEFYGNDGLIYGAVELEENVLGKTLCIESAADGVKAEISSIIG